MIHAKISLVFGFLFGFLAQFGFHLRFCASVVSNLLVCVFYLFYTSFPSLAILPFVCVNPLLWFFIRVVPFHIKFTLMQSNYNIPYVSKSHIIFQCLKIETKKKKKKLPHINFCWQSNNEKRIIQTQFWLISLKVVFAQFSSSLSSWSSAHKINV